jgi:hypothetical protein
MANLTQSQFLIYIEDREKKLRDIYWETCSGVGMTASSITTSNGRQRYNIPSRPVPKNITISKAANALEDYLIEEWCNSFCQNDPVIPGANNSGAVLIIIPLKPCSDTEPYNRTCKVFDIQPVDTTFWNADKLNNTDVSRVEVQLVCSTYKFS